MTLVTNEPGNGLPLARVAIDGRGSHALPTGSHKALPTLLRGTGTTTLTQFPGILH